MPKLTLEEAARQYAWQMGGDDFPATDCCPYNRSKHPSLHSAYWKGWRSARANNKAIPVSQRGSEEGVRRSA